MSSENRGKPQKYKPKGSKKMKYMVLVNRKFMVAVEKDGSNAAAEHVILDNFDGIQGAQAFDRAEMKSNYFADVFQDSETISMKELERMSLYYREAYRLLAEKRDAVKAIKDEIRELEEKLEEANKRLNMAGFEERKAKLNTIEAKRQLNYTED